jgi:predicted DNA-binding protein (MmcQ/YjbR family)
MTVDDIRNISRAFQSVTEDIKWGNDLVFSVGGKMFCVVGPDHSPTSASFKATDDEFDEVSSRPGFSPAPYVAKYKWVLIEDISKMKRADWEHYIGHSYRLVREKLPAKIKRQLES